MTAMTDSAREASSAEPNSVGTLLRKFLPLSLSDVAMALGDPLQTIALTRLPNPQETLASVGVVKAVAVLLESPVIMLLHASTALSGQRASRKALFRFMLVIGAALTAMFVLLSWSPVYDWLLLRVFGVGPSIARTGRITFLLMILWPAAIAWRRFFQGLLIRRGGNRYVGWASMSRIGWVAFMLALGLYLRLDGALLAGLTLMGAVLVEAALVTLFAWLRRAEPAAKGQEENRALPTTLAGVTRFYIPLASTMLLVWGGRAALVSFVARSSDGALALAAWPAAWGFVLSISNATRMVQQVVIASSRETTQDRLYKFVFAVGLGCSAVLAVLAFTPGGAEFVSGALGGDGAIVQKAAPVVQIAVLFPLLLALQNAFQGMSILRGNNWRVNVATVAGVACTLSVAAALVGAGRPGASSAAWAMVAGVALEVLVLALPILGMRCGAPGNFRDRRV